MSEAKNCAWAQQSASRAIGTTYTNTSGKQRYVCITLTMTATAGAGSATAKVLVEFKDSADGGFSTAVNPQVVGALTAVTRVTHAMFMVDNNGSWKITQQGTSSGVGASQSTTITQCFEFDFTGVHTAQAWTNGEQVSALTKPNNYATDVSATIDNDAAISVNILANTAGDYVAQRFTCAKIFTATAGNFGLKDSGGSNVTVASVGAALRDICILANNGGTVNLSVAASSGHGDLRAPVVSGTPIAFTAGESGAATAQKWVDLDDRASQGLNVSQAWVRSTGSGAGVKSAPTRLSFVAARVSLVPSSSSSGTGAIYIATSAGTIVALGQEANTLTGGGITTEIMLFAMVSPGQTYEITASAGGTAVIAAYWIWEIAA